MNEDVSYCHLGEDSLTSNEMKEALEALKIKNSEIRATLNYLKKENVMYKKKYNDLKRSVTSLSEVLEKSAKNLHKMFYDTKCALSKISILNSPLSQKEYAHIEITNQKTNVKPGSSGKRRVSHKFHIEPMNIREMEEILENGQEEQPENDITKNGHLTTIIEERENNSSVGGDKTLCVRLSRLPNDIITEHLEKINVPLVNSPLDNATFERNLSPNCASTPEKLQSLKNLGLIPVSQYATFISTRKRRMERKSLSKCEMHSAPKRKSLAKCEMHSSPKQANCVSNDKKLKPQVNEGRPKRKAKPTVLKEKSLKMKMRGG